jgi:hypothetical protein
MPFGRRLVKVRHSRTGNLARVQFLSFASLLWRTRHTAGQHSLAARGRNGRVPQTATFSAHARGVAAV